MNYELRHFNTPLLRFHATEDSSTPEITILWCDEESDYEGSFSKASVWKRMAIVVAGAVVNILFGILVYFILISLVGIQFADPAKDTLLNELTQAIDICKTEAERFSYYYHHML